MYPMDLRAHTSLSPNGISIGSAVLARLSNVTNTDGDRGVARSNKVGWTVCVGCGEGCPLPSQGVWSGDTI